VTQYFLDILALIFSYLLAYEMGGRITSLNGILVYAWILLVYIPLWIFLMYGRGMYNLTTFTYYDRVLKSVLIASILAALNTAAMAFFIKNDQLSRILFGSFVFTSTVAVLAERYLHTYIVHRFHKYHARNIIVIGTNDISEKFLLFVKKTGLRLKLVKRIRVGEKNEFSDLREEKTYAYLNALLKSEVVDEVIFAVPSGFLPAIEKYALMCEEFGVTVSMVLELYDFKYSQISLSSIGTLPMLTFHSVSLSRQLLLIKRLVDISGALVGLVITALLSILIIPAIKLDSPGPAIFTQQRMGMNRRVFRLYKFRTMVVNAEDQKQELMALNKINGDKMFKISDDPRVTRVGKVLRKTSLDELPQFFNVLKGEMSLVGTRPPTLDEVPKYENHQWRRMSIKPGMTGLWQISGRSSITNFEDVVRLDTQYIDTWSIRQDIMILAKTVLAVLGKRGAS